MKKYILVVALLAAFTAGAQKKQLTLEESVMQQARAFRADVVTAFQWVPNTNRYVFLAEGGKKLMSATSQNTTAAEWLTLADFNKANATEARSFAGFEFRDDHTLVVPVNGKWVSFDLTSKTGKTLFTLEKDADNATHDDIFSHVAYTVDNNLFYADVNGKSIAVTQNTDKNIVSGQFIARNEFGINNGIFWSPKSAYLAFYQKDQTDVADYPLLDINETPGKLVSIKYPMAGQLSEKPKVGIYNLATQQTVFIAPRGKADDYVTNLSWTPDEKYIVIAELNRGQNDMHLNLYDAQTGKFVRTLLEEQSNAWVEPEHPAFFPDMKSNNFIWISEKDGFNNLYYYSIEGKLIAQLTKNKFPAREILGANAAGTEVWFKATGPNPMNMLAYKVTLKGKQSLLTPNDGVHTVAASTDGKWIFDEYSNHDTPSRSLLTDASGKSKEILKSANKYEGYVMGTADIRTIKAADGTTDLYTRLIKPSNFDPSKKYPVLVYVYGGPHAQLVTNAYLDGASLWMYWMAEQGYLVFTVDSRGSDNRGVAFESVIHRRVGYNEMEDQLKGVDYLKSLPYVDGNRLAVHGWSFGGFMTTSLMLRKPDVFKVGVAGGPVTDWKYYEVMYGERYMDTPSENPDGFKENSTLNYADKLKGKLLLIHGTSDDVVVMQQNLALIKKFVEAGKQMDFFAYPMHKHNVTGKDRVHLMQKVLDYVIDHNQ